MTENSMNILASFYTQGEAMAYIEKNTLDGVIVDHNIFSGKYDVLDTES